eukprot:TRINITY_DN2917_c0_g1_i1.p1 TRINITY_DN2917_c0_g1~~TRINITY_DN2917_c0_g1_i1.p1  ORF type:complete len:165 (-),score=34.61 TRINITY_DN2917_c0_g1_i1:329-823(-)
MSRILCFVVCIAMAAATFEQVDSVVPDSEPLDMINAADSLSSPEETLFEPPPTGRLNQLSEEEQEEEDAEDAPAPATEEDQFVDDIVPEEQLFGRGKGKGFLRRFFARRRRSSTGSLVQVPEEEEAQEEFGIGGKGKGFLRRFFGRRRRSTGSLVQRDDVVEEE